MHSSEGACPRACARAAHGNQSINQSIKGFLRGVALLAFALASLLHQVVVVSGLGNQGGDPFLVPKLRVCLGLAL